MSRKANSESCERSRKGSDHQIYLSRPYLSSIARALLEGPERGSGDKKKGIFVSVRACTRIFVSVRACTRILDSVRACFLQSLYHDWFSHGRCTKTDSVLKITRSSSKRLAGLPYVVLPVTHSASRHREVRLDNCIYVQECLLSGTPIAGLLNTIS